MQILVNGQPHSVDRGCSIVQLIERLDLAGKRVAVERNGEIVPKSRHGETVLDEGDRLEVVVAVGGG